MIEIFKNNLENYTFIDLFAGIGGFRIALESLGAECVYSSEWDKFAQKVYYENFGELPDGDITKVNEYDIPDHDILCAGFPCQAFSISGNQRGFEDSRGTLFFDVARIIKAKKPKVVFMENVRNFARHDKGRTLEVVKGTMEELGYRFNAEVLNSADYGIPQQRQRIYMVCFRKDLGIESFIFPKGFKLEKHLEDFLLPDEEVKDLIIERNDIVFKKNVQDEYSNKPIRVATVGKGGQGERIYSPKGVAITLSANGGGVFAKTGGYLINGRTRRLHVRECARIMGFPEKFKICENKNQAYKQFGNSVVVDIIQLIAKNISEYLKEKGEPLQKKELEDLFNNKGYYQLDMEELLILNSSNE